MLKTILIAFAGLASIAVGAAVYEHRAEAVAAKRDERFVRLSKADPAGFSRHVELAASKCVQAAGLSDATLKSLHRASGKVVTIMMLERSSGAPIEDRRERVGRRVEAEIGPELRRLPEREVAVVLKRLGTVASKPETVNCIVSSTVSSLG